MAEKPRYTEVEFATEYRQYARSPEWILARVKKALSMLSMLNSSQECARLAAVTVLLRRARQRNVGA